MDLTAGCMLLMSAVAVKQRHKAEVNNTCHNTQEHADAAALSCPYTLECLLVAADAPSLGVMHNCESGAREGGAGWGRGALMVRGNREAPNSASYILAAAFSFHIHISFQACPYIILQLLMISPFDQAVILTLRLLQIDQAQAAGVAFPVMTTSDGRPVLKYSDLMQKGRVFEADGVTEEGIAAAAAARVRAERLNALQAQTSAGASTAATVAKPAEDSDEEGFLHATALGSLPEHLRRSDSQVSDSDVLVSSQQEEDQHAAESVHKVQQDVRKDKQADYKSV